MVPLSVHRLRSFDGTELAYYRAGRSRGPTLIMCNGLGGNIVVWRRLIERFAPSFRILCWDYRGLYGSSPATTPNSYAMPFHAQDLARLIQQEEVTQPILVGWSMGVQVSLELHRNHPDLAAAIVAIHGTQGRALRTAFDSRVPERVAPYVFSALRRIGRGLEEVGPPFARSAVFVGSLVWAAQSFGVMARDLDEDAFSELAEEWLQMDMGVYAEIFHELGQHDARDLLPEITTPTLVIAGGADRFTPAHLSERMADDMPDAVLRYVDRATHFGLLEFPDQIGDCIDEFLAERKDIAVR